MPEGKGEEPLRQVKRGFHYFLGDVDDGCNPEVSERHVDKP